MDNWGRAWSKTRTDSILRELWLIKTIQHVEHSNSPGARPVTYRSRQTWCLCAEVNPRRWCQAHKEVLSPEHDAGTGRSVKRDGRLNVCLRCLKQGAPCQLVWKGDFGNYLRKNGIHVRWLHVEHGWFFFFLHIIFQHLHCYTSLTREGCRPV